MRTLTQPRRGHVDQVLDQARRAVHTARAQRDQLQREFDRLDAENRQLRAELAAPLPKTQPMGDDLLLQAATPLVEVIDHLGRALLSKPAPDDPWFKGMAAVLSRARVGLDALGVQTVGAVGEPFDPRLHDAIGTLPTPDFEPDTLVDVLETGLRTTEGVLLRAARVVVSR